MKKVFPALALTLFLSVCVNAQDVAVYGLTTNQVLDNNSGLIAGYSAMESTFAVALISNVYLEAAMFEGLNTPVRGSYDYEISFAEVGFSVPASVVTDYYFAAKYYLELIDVQPCGWVDYYGFSLYGGDYFSPYTWEPGITVCATLDLIYLGGIAVINGLTGDSSQFSEKTQQISGCKTGSFRECSAGGFDTATIKFKYTRCSDSGTEAPSYTKRRENCYRYKYICGPGGYTLKRINTCMGEDPSLDLDKSFTCSSCS
jgi:hypothetical protein